MQSHVLFPSQMEKVQNREMKGVVPDCITKGWGSKGGNSGSRARVRPRAKAQAWDLYQGAQQRHQTHTEPCKLSLVLWVFTESSEPLDWPLRLTHTVCSLLIYCLPVPAVLPGPNTQLDCILFNIESLQEKKNQPVARSDDRPEETPLLKFLDRLWNFQHRKCNRNSQ